jgi:hypothetical protein
MKYITRMILAGYKQYWKWGWGYLIQFLPTERALVQSNGTNMNKWGKL